MPWARSQPGEQSDAVAMAQEMTTRPTINTNSPTHVQPPQISNDRDVPQVNARPVQPAPSIAKHTVSDPSKTTPGKNNQSPFLPAATSTDVRPKELKLHERLRQTINHFAESNRALQLMQQRVDRTSETVAQLRGQITVERAASEHQAAEVKRLRSAKHAATSESSQTDLGLEISRAALQLRTHRRNLTSLTKELNLAVETMATYSKNADNLSLRTTRLESRKESLQSEYDSIVGSTPRATTPDPPKEKRRRSASGKHKENNSFDGDIIVHRQPARTSIPTPTNGNGEAISAATNIDAFPASNRIQTSLRQSAPVPRAGKNNTDRTEPQRHKVASPPRESISMTPSAVHESDAMTNIYKEQVQSLRRITNEQSRLIDKLYQEIESLRANSVCGPLGSLSSRPSNLPTLGDSRTAVEPIGPNNSPNKRASTASQMVPTQGHTVLLNQSSPVHHSPTNQNKSPRDPRLSLAILINPESVPGPTKEAPRVSAVIQARTKVDQATHTNGFAKDSVASSAARNPPQSPAATTPPREDRVSVKDSTKDPTQQEEVSEIDKRTGLKQSNRCTTCVEKKKYCNGEPICEACKLFYIGNELPEQYCNYPFILKNKVTARITPADYIPLNTPEEADSALASLQLKRKSRFWRTSTSADFPELQSVEPEGETPVPQKAVESTSQKRSDRLRAKDRRRYDSPHEVADESPAPKRLKTSSEAALPTVSPIVRRHGSMIVLKYRQAKERQSVTPGANHKTKGTKSHDPPASQTTDKASRESTRPQDPRHSIVTANSPGSFRPMMPNFD